MSESTQTHWDRVYTKKTVETLGWYEDEPTTTMELIGQCQLGSDDRILIVGAGATTLIDRLLEQQYRNLIATDISPVALETLKARIGEGHAAQIQWVVDDLTNPVNLPKLAPITLWQDRAVLHFLTEAEQRQSYFGLLRSLVKIGGYVIIAAFALDGATQCSGLDVRRYDTAMLQAELGDGFTLLQAFPHLYTMPSGDTRSYVYTLFQRDT